MTEHLSVKLWNVLRGSVGPDVQGGVATISKWSPGHGGSGDGVAQGHKSRVQNKSSRLIHGEQRKIVESTNWPERRAGDTEILARTEKIDRALIEWVE